MTRLVWMCVLLLCLSTGAQAGTTCLGQACKEFGAAKDVVILTPPPITGVVCIGRDACKFLISARCSIALGDGVSLPDGADHIAVFDGQVIPVKDIDGYLLFRIADEIERMGQPRRTVLDIQTNWRKSCLDTSTS